ncbi:MAG TPA: sigma-70 family RNA polymerase sigma factor [Gelidibacter sp.]|uniref:RNA polymerase sigma factor n=1 Tax=Gelidibacter sp. TaxID=2018083 RepID=UPI002B9E70D9|nr:sigma-70 family RNA polymerase sigma factor [Gelidibacter sp.]HXJ99612.1 sigma-70 family RNA polymerase sigma factor [Gelidibacter sp.]
MKAKSTVTLKEIESLFKEHYTFLCLVSFSILKDKDASKDIVHDFFVSYWQKKDTITLKVSFQAYAVRAIKNLSLAAVKKANKEQSLDKITLNQPDEESDHTLDRSKNYDKLWELLNQLPKSRKEIFISSVIDGQSYAEIAESNGISINTVKTQMKRAYAFLRSKAKKHNLVIRI